jgi:hypothetical protein
MNFPKEYYTGEYFGPDNLTDEWRGYFETLEEVSPYRYLGMRLMPELPIGRLPGANFCVDFDLKENLTLLKGHKQVIIKASPKRPLRVRSTIGILGGPRKNLQSETQ